MKRIASTLGFCLIGLVASAPQAISSTNVTSQPSQVAANLTRIAQSASAEYETYYNSRFDFAVKYPSDRLNPEPPPTNNDGRTFVAPSGSIEMKVYGYHQNRETLGAVYRQRLQDLRQGGAEVTYDYLGDDEFILSGYDANNQVFYRRVLLRHNDFLVLDITYDHALQPEFDTVVAEISNSFRASDRAARERQVQVYFPATDGNELEDVNPVTRTTTRTDVAEFAIEQFLAGPTPAEQNQNNVRPLEFRFTGTSVCGNQDFTLDIESDTAILQFCRTLRRPGIGYDAPLESGLRETLQQFNTVEQVVLLNKFGRCLIDYAGNDACLEKLPTSAQ